MEDLDDIAGIALREAISEMVASASKEEGWVVETQADGRFRAENPKGGKAAGRILDGDFAVRIEGSDGSAIESFDPAPREAPDLSDQLTRGKASDLAGVRDSRLVGGVGLSPHQARVAPDALDALAGIFERALKRSKAAEAKALRPSLGTNPLHRQAFDMALAQRMADMADFWSTSRYSGEATAGGLDSLMGMFGKPEEAKPENPWSGRRDRLAKAGIDASRIEDAAIGADDLPAFARDAFDAIFDEAFAKFADDSDEGLDGPLHKAIATGSTHADKAQAWDFLMGRWEESEPDAGKAEFSLEALLAPEPEVERASFLDDGKGPKPIATDEQCEQAVAKAIAAELVRWPEGKGDPSELADPASWKVAETVLSGDGESFNRRVEYRGRHIDGVNRIEAEAVEHDGSIAAYVVIQLGDSTFQAARAGNPSREAAEEALKAASEPALLPPKGTAPAVRAVVMYARMKCAADKGFLQRLAGVSVRDGTDHAYWALQSEEGGIATLSFKGPSDGRSISARVDTDTMAVEFESKAKARTAA